MHFLGVSVKCIAALSSHVSLYWVCMAKFCWQEASRDDPCWNRVSVRALPLGRMEQQRLCDKLVAAPLPHPAGGEGEKIVSEAMPRRRQEWAKGI